PSCFLRLILVHSRSRVPPHLYSFPTRRSSDLRLSRVRLLFAGTPEVAVPSLRALLESEHEVVGVVTRPDAKVGRGRRLTPSPVRSEEHTSELQSRFDLVCRLGLEKNKILRENV